MKKRNDIKFIIYQSLYIFVICVIAIKGADINLDEVELKKLLQANHDYIDTSANKVIPKDEYAKMIIFDPTKYMIVSIDDYKKDPISFKPIEFGPGGPIGPIGDYDKPDDKKDNPDTKPVDPGIDNVTYSFPSNFVQFRVNPINNPNNVDMIVQSSSGSVTIPPKSTKNVTIMGDNTITLSAGGQTKSYPVKDNKKPQIMFSRMTSMDENTRASVLQRTTCYRVTISDDFADQIDVKISGPVTFKEVGSGVYDVIMNAFGSKTAFDNFTDTKPNSPYSIGFTVSAKDKISGHSVTGQQSFIFGEW